MKRTASRALSVVRFNTPPCPASRPRVGKFGTYYAKTYKLFRKGAGEEAESFDAPPTDRPLVLLADAVFEKPKTGKLEFPRGDTDNIAKGPLDILQRAEKAFKDDNQVVGLIAFKRYALPGEDAGLNVSWFEVDVDE